MPENHEKSRMCGKYVTTTAKKKKPGQGMTGHFEFTESNT
jgi:hypothetical protein